MKLKVGDTEIYREDSSFATAFDFNVEPLYIIFDLISDWSFLSPYKKKNFLLKKATFTSPPT